MPARDYRTRVLFKSKSDTVDSLGQRSETLTDITTAGGRISSIPVQERVSSGLSTSEAQIIIDCRYSSSLANVDSSSVLEINGDEYEILSIDSGDFQDRDIRFYARERR